MHVQCFSVFVSTVDVGQDSSAGGVPRGLSAGSRLRRQTEIGRIRRGTGQASSPGDFGLLDIPLVSGSDSTRDLLADKEFGESGATTKTAHEAKFSMLVPYLLFMLCGQSMSFVCCCCLFSLSIEIKTIPVDHVEFL